MTRAPQIRGWCPGALRPMVSGDGLIVRVRPRGGRIDPAQAGGLAALALAHGNGLVDLSNRANVQLRGIRPETHADLLDGLRGLGLLDDDVMQEIRRNIVVQPFWQAGDVTEWLAAGLAARLDGMPELPGKFGYAIDTGPRPLLHDTPADIRLERDARGGLIVVADGCDTGRAVSEADAVSRIAALAGWFAAARGPHERMKALLAAGATLPAEFDMPRQAPDPRPLPGMQGPGALVALAFGQMSAETLAALGRHGPLRMTPWRMILIEGAARPPDLDAIITDPADPLLRVIACIGAPGCAQAQGDTRALARRLAPLATGVLHVSGCAKGCAHPRAAPLTVTATPQGYDLIREGRASDDPARRDLTPDILTKAI